MSLPTMYNWLSKEGAPKILVEGLKVYGTKEIVGAKHNPVIMTWAKELGLKAYTSDEIAWCGLFVAWCVHQSGRTPVKDPLWARNWAKWGVATKTAMLGDILVFTRGSGGHVGIYVGEDDTCYHVLGGNQSNQVNITRIQKNRTIAIRRPAYINQPANVRVVKLSATGVISKNEA